jgi:hypothetical protein
MLFRAIRPALNHLTASLDLQVASAPPATERSLCRIVPSLLALRGSHLTSAGFSTLTLRTLAAKILATRQISSLDDISLLFGIPLIHFAPNHPHGPHERWESQKGRQIVPAFCAIIPFSDRHSSA